MMKACASRRRTAGVFTVAAIALVTTSVAADPQRETSAETRPAFEAATIKLAAPNDVRNWVMPTSPNRLYIPSMTLTWLVYTAYGDGGFNTSMRVTGGPDWVNKTAFAIEAVAPGDVPMGDVLALVVERSDGTLGPKIKKWDGTCPPVMPVLYFQAPRRPLPNGSPSEADDPAVPYCPTGYRAGGITVDGATMFTVAELLSLPPARVLLGTITQDRTGLTDRYSMDLDYPFASPGPAPGAPPEFAGPSLSTAVREQWGLRLVPSKGRVKVIVVESAQPPTGN